MPTRTTRVRPVSSPAAFRAMTFRGPAPVGAGVAPADNDDILAVGTQLILHLHARVDAVLLGQEFHREMHAFQLAPRDRQITRALRATGHDHGVKFVDQFFFRHFLLM